MALLRVVPAWAWVLMAVLGWGGWQRHQAHAAGAELLRLQASISLAREQALQASITETERRIAAQQEAVHAADLSASAARADAAGAAAVAARLRARLAAAANPRASDPAAAGQREAADETARVLADVLTRADERAGILAATADAHRIAGIACEQAYDALTLPH